MTSFTPQVKGLRRAMGALSLGFMVAAVNAPTNAAPANANEPPPPPGSTTASAMIADIERQANDYLKTTAKPAHRVVMIDTDQINTSTESRVMEHTQKIRLYLQGRGINLSGQDHGSIRWSMGGPYGPHHNDPQAQTLTTTNTPASDVCVILPETADLSSRSLLEKWVGAAGQKHLVAAIDPGPYQMARRVAWHEAWHCMDPEFVQAYKTIDSDKGFEFALGIHRAEMFADVAATLTMAAQGNVEIISQTADARAVSSRWNGPKMMIDYSPKYDAGYYSGITYYTTLAHDAALAHISSIGINKVKTYSLGDIQRIATELTRNHALNAEQFRAVADYLKQDDSYLLSQKQKAAANNAAAKRNVAFITEYQNRTQTARARILTETAMPVIPKDDVLPPTMHDVLQATPQQEKMEIFTIMENAILAAKNQGQSARQGVMNQLEAWRKELHSAPTPRKDLEDKLYLASLLLSNGYLDTLLNPALLLQPHSPSI